MNLKRNHLLFLWGISFFLFFFCLIGIETGYLTLFDQWCYDCLMEHSNLFWTIFFSFFTNFGSLEILLLVVLLFYLLSKDKKALYFLGFNFCFLGGIGLITKYSIARIRPTIFPMIHETGYSFPSAHALLSSTVYFFMVLYLLPRLKKQRMKEVAILGCFLFVLCIGISRIYLGVHYTSDVLAGFALGMLLVSMELLWIQEKRTSNFRKRIAYSKKI